MKTMKTPLLAALAPAAILAAAVPVGWEVEVTAVRPAHFSAYRGETLELSAAMLRRGEPYAPRLADARLYWQTNGMGSAYWSAPAACASNVLTAVWSPSNDVGAASYSCFIGEAGGSYRAAFRLSLLPSPGASPNALEPPVRTLDFAAVELRNLRALTNGWSFGSEPGDYPAVSNRAMQVSMPGDEGHPPFVYTPLFRGRADYAESAGELYLHQSPCGLALHGGRWGMRWGYGPSLGYEYLPFAYVSEVSAAAAAATNHADEVAAAATNGVFKVDSRTGFGTLLDYGYLYRLGIAWEPWNVLWMLPGDPDGEARFIDGMTKEINIASANYVDRKVAAAASAGTNYTDAAIRERSLGGIWDSQLEVWWTPRMRNGNLTYEATTNVNLDAEN